MFAPGDEVVCVDAGDIPPLPGNPPRAVGAPLVEGATYTVTGTACWLGEVGVHLKDFPSRHPSGAFLASRFRKVQRRTSGLTVEAFLTIQPGQFEEPKRRVPAPKREEASS